VAAKASVAAGSESRAKVVLIGAMYVLLDG